MVVPAMGWLVVRRCLPSRGHWRQSCHTNMEAGQLALEVWLGGLLMRWLAM
jgi:hypothetical protein